MSLDQHPSFDGIKDKGVISYISTLASSVALVSPLPPLPRLLWVEPSTGTYDQVKFFFLTLIMGQTSLLGLGMVLCDLYDKLIFSLYCQLFKCRDALEWSTLTILVEADYLEALTLTCGVDINRSAMLTSCRKLKLTWKVVEYLVLLIYDVAKTFLVTIWRISLELKPNGHLAWFRSGDH